MAVTIPSSITEFFTRFPNAQPVYVSDAGDAYLAHYAQLALQDFEGGQQVARVNAQGNQCLIDASGTCEIVNNPPIVLLSSEDNFITGDVPFEPGVDNVEVDALQLSNGHILQLDYPYGFSDAEIDRLGTDIEQYSSDAGSASTMFRPLSANGSGRVTF